MFGYYTALAIITSSVIITALLVIHYDNVLEKFNKFVFIISYLALFFICISEWLVVYLEKIHSNMHILTTFSMGIVLFIAPSITAILSLGINDKMTKLHASIVVIIVVFSFMLGFSGLFSDAIFYYDEQNTYHRGTLYPLHVTTVMVSALTLLVNTFRVGLKYQNKNNYILALTFLIFVMAYFTQFAFNGVWILWISYTLAISFGYIYYSSLVNQIDILTSIFNRKCFDSQIYDIKSNAIILFFDVNDFKKINDTHGHAAGDYCLKEIAKAIKEVYGKSGDCYRIGGDEFSVILYKNLDSVEELNTKFSNLISEKKYIQTLPTVSIGHSYYYPKQSSIQKAIEDADAMMYSLKQQRS